MLPFTLAQQYTGQTKASDIINDLARTPLSKVLMLVAICTLIRLALYPYMKSVPAHQRSGLFTVARFFNEAMDAIVYAGVFVFLVIRPFFIQAFKIPSESMLDTLLVNDFIVANKAIFRYSEPQFQDIIVFRPPGRACTPEQFDADGQVNVDFIKRCIGLPGDLIQIQNGTLYRNGKAVNESYIKEKPVFDFKLVKYKGSYWPVVAQNNAANWKGSFPIADEYGVSEQSEMDALIALPAEKVPAGYFIMMGDNRNGSFDSRGWGLVPRDEIVGRAELIWFPINRWRRTH